MTTDSCGILNLGQNGGYQSNQGQITSPSGEFKETPEEEPAEGPRGNLAQTQRSTQSFKATDMGMSQGWGVGLGHVQKPKTKSRGRGWRGRGRGIQGVNQLGGQQNQGKRGLHGGKAAQSSDFVDSDPATNSTCSNSLRGPSVGDYPSRRGQGKRVEPWNSVNRRRGQGGLGRAQSLSDIQSACHSEAIEQSRFQQNQLLVSGLSASTTEDCLVNFIEAMSGGEVEDVMMTNDKALITMTNDITGKSCQGMTSRFI